MQPKRIIIQIVSFIVVVAIVVHSYFWFKAHKKAKALRAIQAVSVLEIKPQDTPLYFEYNGRLAGFKEVDIQSQVTGIILKRGYKEGDIVQKGQLLFQIDPAPFKALVAQAAAQLKNAQASEWDTKRIWERDVALLKSGAISTQDAELSKANYEQAIAGVMQAQAALKTANINLGYTTIKAPFLGLAGAAVVYEGHIVDIGTNSGLLTKMTQLDPVYVNFAYPETDMKYLTSYIEKGITYKTRDGKMYVQIVLADGSTYEKEGVVDFTDKTVDAQVAGIVARGVIQNPDKKIFPGQFVKVRVTGFGWRNAILIPERALVQLSGKTCVYTVSQDNKVVANPVTIATGPHVDNNVIIESGLKAGDRLIVEGVIKVQAGATVSIQTQTAQMPPVPLPTVQEATPVANVAPTSTVKTVEKSTPSEETKTSEYSKPSQNASFPKNESLTQNSKDNQTAQDSLNKK